MLLPVVQAKVIFCRRILSIDVLSLKQERIRAHEWDAPTVESAQPITRSIRVVLSRQFVQRETAGK